MFGFSTKPKTGPEMQRQLTLYPVESLEIESTQKRIGPNGHFTYKPAVFKNMLLRNAGSYGVRHVVFKVERAVTGPERRISDAEIGYAALLMDSEAADYRLEVVLPCKDVLAPAKDEVVMASLAPQNPQEVNDGDIHRTLANTLLNAIHGNTQ